MRVRLQSALARLRQALSLAVAATALLAAPLAFAGQTVSLRPDVSSAGAITLGDLFDATGPAAAIVIGNGAPSGQSAVLDAGEVQRLAHLHGLDWGNPNGIRRIIVRSEAGGRINIEAGSARTVDALTYTRNMMAGDIIQPQDLTYAKVPTFSAPQDMPRDAEMLIGKMAKRPLRAGAPAEVHDVSAAQVIRRDDVVQVSYRADGISLVLEGKAMGAATVGEPIAVQNTASKKVVQAIAVGPDQAVVGPDAEQFRAATMLNPNQFAANR